MERYLKDSFERCIYEQRLSPVYVRFQNASSYWGIQGKPLLMGNVLKAPITIIFINYILSLAKMQILKEFYHLFKIY